MLAEYHAFKMVLEDSLELDDESNPSSVLPTGQGPSMNDPTSADQGLLNAAAKRKEISPREELSLMKKTTGGFKLALKLTTEDLYYHSHILLEVTRPQDSVKRSAQLALGGWKKSEHLQKTVAVLQNSTFLQFISESGLSGWVMQMTSLTEHLLKQRVWSLSRHGCPPESYAGILAADNEQVQQEAVRLLKKEHQVLLWLETVFASRSSFGLVQGICDKLSASVHLIVSKQVVTRQPVWQDVTC